MGYKGIDDVGESNEFGFDMFRDQIRPAIAAQKEERNAAHMAIHTNTASCYSNRATS